MRISRLSNNPRLAFNVAKDLLDPCRRGPHTNRLVIVGPAVQPMRVLSWLTEKYLGIVVLVQAGTDADVDTLESVLRRYSATTEDLDNVAKRGVTLQTYKQTPPEARPAKKIKGEKQAWLDPAHAKVYASSTVNHMAHGFAVNYHEVTSQRDLTKYATDVGSGVYRAYSNPHSTPTLYSHVPMHGKELVLPIRDSNITIAGTLFSSVVEAQNDMIRGDTFGYNACIVALRKPMRKHSGRFDGYALDVNYALARLHFSRAYVARMISGGFSRLTSNVTVRSSRNDEDSQFIGNIGENLLTVPVDKNWRPFSERLPWFNDPLNEHVDTKLAAARSQYFSLVPGGSGSEILRLDRDVYNTLSETIKMLGFFADRLQSHIIHSKERERLENQREELLLWANTHTETQDGLRNWCELVRKYYASRYPLLGYAMGVEKAEHRPKDPPIGQSSKYVGDYVQTMSDRWAANKPEDRSALAEQEMLMKQIIATDTTVYPGKLPPYVQIDADVVPNIGRIIAEHNAAGYKLIDMTAEEYLPAGVQPRCWTDKQK